MKNLFFTLFLLGINHAITAQVGIGTTNPDPSSILDISASDKGVLVPRIALSNIADTSLDGTNPASEGLLIYNTNASVGGGSGVGYYIFNGTSWNKLVTSAEISDDADFFEEGGITAPDAITDDIYTQGNVAIGKTAADYSLDIETTGNRGVSNDMNGTGSAAQSGIYNLFDVAATGARYGVDNQMTASGSNFRVGVQNFIQNNTGSFALGTSTTLNNTGNTQQWGEQLLLLGNASGVQYGTFANINNSGNGDHYGERFILGGSGSGNHFGNYTTLTAGSGTHYGSFHLLQSSGAGDKYGYYSRILTSAGGTHYGIYSDVQKTGSFAGYFIGDVRMESLGGSGDQMVIVDNDGDLSAQALPGNDADFFEEGTTNAPDAITDDIYTQGNVAIGKTTADYSLDISTTGDRGVSNDMNGTGSSTQSGIYNLFDVAATGARYGVDNQMTASGSNFRVGVQNFIQNNTGGFALGTSTTLNNSGTTQQWGEQLLLLGNASGVQYGTFANINNSGNGDHYGERFTLGGSGSGNHFGNYTSLTAGSGTHYGSFHLLQSNGGGDKYGYYSRILTSAGGTHYGVYSDVQKTGSFAGYFMGEVRMENLGGSGTQMVVADNDGDLSTQAFPTELPAGGNNGDVLSTDGAGSYSWVADANDNDIDWYEVGTTSNPNAITDNIFTQGQVGIGATALNNASQLEVSTEGTNAALHLNVNSNDRSTVTLRRSDNSYEQGIAFQNSGASHSAVVYHTSQSATDGLNEGLTIATIGNIANPSSVGETATFKNDGTMRLHDYGIGSNEDTAPVYLLGVQADGDLVEYDNSVGAVSSPTFSSGWQDYSVANGNSYEDARYYIRDNRVHLAGLIRKTSGIANGDTMITLPVGYRPLKRRIFNMQSEAGAVRIDVQADGQVRWLSAVYNGGQNWVSLDGISFRID